jgi:uncharacterized protein YidB (DUF937 family)
MSRGFPSMTALLGLLAVAGYQNRDKIGELLGGLAGGKSPAAPGGQTDLGGLLGKLGGSLGGAGAGGLLSGGLNELVNRFQQNGLGDKAESWVAPGPNKPVSPPELEQAIGPDVLQDLIAKTGLPREELLKRLSQELPQAVDKYTPEGRLPSAA